MSGFLELDSGRRVNIANIEKALLDGSHSACTTDEERDGVLDLITAVKRADTVSAAYTCGVFSDEEYAMLRRIFGDSLDELYAWLDCFDFEATP